MSAEDDIREALIHHGDFMRIDQLLEMFPELPAEALQVMLDDMWLRGLVTRKAEGLVGKERTYKAILPRP